MKKKTIIGIISLFVLSLILLLAYKSKDLNVNKNIPTNNIEVTILKKEHNLITVQDKDNIVYTFKSDIIDTDIGNNIILTYSGILDKNKEIQDISVIEYKENDITTTSVESTIPIELNDEGIFSKYYEQAYELLKTLTIDEKIGQLLLVRYDDNIDNLKKYQFSGYVFFEKDFKNKTKEQVINMIKKVQDNSKIPLLVAVDEEGGIVNRVSTNTNLRSSPFLSSSELYELGGFNKIKEDTIEKSQLLYSLGINLNLAPVVDIANEDAYIYNRTFKKGTDLTTKYATTVIETSKNTKVSYTLKHFPGYGNNLDTHNSKSIDERTLESITNNDLLPFKSGIKAGAEAILISHNTVNAIDEVNPASLSPSIHNMLRNNMEYTGVIMTDDLYMGAVKDIQEKVKKAILSGNDLLIVTDYESAFNEIKEGLNNKDISESLIDKLAFRILSWKFYKGLLYVNQK